MKTTIPQQLGFSPRHLWQSLTRSPLWLFGLACLVAGQLGAATAIIYTNDFEAYTSVATSEADTTDADPTGIEWNIADDTALLPTTAGAGVQVINWLTNNSGAPTKSLLVRPNAEAQVYLLGARSGSRYQLDFWALIARGPTSSQSFYIILRGEGSDYNGDDYFAYRTDRATNSRALYYYDGVADTTNGTPGAWKAVGVSHTTNTWQHHRIVINPNALTLDIYLDDMVTPVRSGVDLSRCEVAVPTLLRIVNEANSADDGYFAIDDLSLTVEDSRDLTTTFTEGFEGYPARVDAGDDADPQGPWITTELDGTGVGRLRAPAKVQVVDSSVVTPHSGSKCLKLEAGQRAGSTIAWGVPPQSDVQITWWARVPASVAGQTANYLRMSLYGAENYNTLGGDNALLGYGSRQPGLGDETSLTYYITAWLDSGIDYTPDTWEEYRLTTHTAQGRYTIIKNPSGASPEVVVDRAPFIGTATNWAPVFMAAWSSSNGTNHPPVYVDDIEIKSLVSIPDPLGDPYTVTNYGTRFTNVTILNLGGPIGRPAVDPRDNTILFAVDLLTAGGIYRAPKVASGNWGVDPVPIVSGLDRPSGLTVETNGTIWWTHDYNNNYVSSVARLKAPWASNSPEIIIADVDNPADTNRDDDAIDITVAPGTFSGSIGQPFMMVVADRGVDADNYNALYVIDPATTNLNQTGYSNFLLGPLLSPGDLGGNLNAITSLPASGEVVVASEDGFLVAVNGDGTKRYIIPSTLWMSPPAPSAAAIALDPQTGRLWIADDVLNEIWSVDPSSFADQRELGFPLTNPSRPERQIDFHDPGMAFAPDGSFLVVSDTSMVNGGGRLLIFHNEPYEIPPLTITSVARSGGGPVQLSWSSAGNTRYDIQRGTNVADPASFQTIATNLAMPILSFTDTNAPPNQAFYRVVARP